MERPSFKEALKFWFKLGWISFGGTAGHIALMHDFLVDKKRWISNSRFFHALSICMLLPGPEAQQLAIYIGKELHGKKGGLVAGILFVLPSALILLVLSIIYASFGNQPWIYAMFSGLKPAVIALIILALFKIGQKSLNGWLQYLTAALAFICIFFFNTPLLAIIAGTIVVALILKKFFPHLLSTANGTEDGNDINEEDYYLNKVSKPNKSEFNRTGLIRQVLAFVLLWLIPFGILYFYSADFSFWKRLILFFTQSALFTIGGSYTVLPYVAQYALDKFLWLSKAQMIDGFALAETTPGPLIIVVGFVGFMAGINHFHHSLALGSLALGLTIYYTFLPCFLYIFVGGPLIEKSHSSATISDLLKLVTAAIVGVILNLTIFLGKDVIFPKGVSLPQINLFSLSWVILCIVLLSKFRLNVIYIILLSILVSLIHYRYPIF
ncbi:MAG: chromate efflux transporter [Mucilaginibacter sp.]|uniref:chromate efflux transporter n=1 Tax=Mucilaginibacter sp. TaxID=1882438 RepID=UPI0031A89937